MKIDKVKKLCGLISGSKKGCPENLRLFFITEKEFIRICKGHINTSWFAEEHGVVKNLRFTRGDILELFSKLEFLINELILLKILDSNSDTSYMLSDVLESIPFFQKIKFLKKWKIINKDTSTLLFSVKDVRNGFAHAWGEGEIEYKSKRIEENFALFKQDMELIWKALIAVYKLEQEKIDVDRLIEMIVNLNR